MRLQNRTSRVGAAVAAGAAILAAAAYFTGLIGRHPKLSVEPASANVEDEAEASRTVELSENQVAAIKVEPAGEHSFALEKSAVGNIDYNEDMEVHVFTNYQEKSFRPPWIFPMSGRNRFRAFATLVRATW